MVNPSKIDIAHWLSDPELARLLKTLGETGEIRFIGGSVRDAILGIEHNDLDLATPALPDTVMKHARASGFHIVPTGLDHGTVTAILERGHVEITTLRRDVDTDGRHATVAFTDDWQEDAARRDFTMNALSCAIDGKVFDYFGGVEDLQAGRVRFIGKAEERIAEDYLRILRFFRFTARYGKGEPDGDALAAINRLSPRMTQLSGERIQSEILKLLASPRAVEMWQLIIDTGVVAAILGGATDTRRLKRVIEIEQEHGLNDGFRRLIAVMTVPSLATIADRLKLSNAHYERLVAAHDETRLARIRAGNYGAALYGADPQSVIDLAILDSTEDDEVELYGLFTFLKSWTQPKFPLGGDALMEMGLKPGPIFGELLGHVEQWWIGENFAPTRQECFAELKRIWAQRKSTA